MSFYFHDVEKDYCAETLLEALRQPTEYSLYICNWDQKQKQFIKKLENLFGVFMNAASKNRLKELHYAMNRHYASVSKSARTTEKYISEKTKKYRAIMSLSYKDYNAFFFETLCMLGKDYDEILKIISNAKDELESVVEKQVSAGKRIIKDAFKLELNAAWGELRDMYLEDWLIKRQRLLDYQTAAVFEVIETETSEDDYIWVNRFANAVTGFEIEYWNDEKEVELEQCLTKIFRQFEEMPANGEAMENEIRLVLERDGNQKIAQFDNKELSSTSQVMFNKMKSTIGNFGQALSVEEKMQVLAKLLSEIM